ncbi:sodium- and chloride-dependent creatine transporter 1-like [Acanthaster planci]|uniref:Transporter n=1 Tax=Acanthaster planci TaxID=133434 RepID=A0A8B7ZCH3_ACAPL|nr:sodium- and chloride-dependent creatine transporter 1-like [Acanthaster planci]XP_022102536.1 sodium- and chloride-dependent creatine transporter 1-like [Acanthaster planci]
MKGTGPYPPLESDNSDGNPDQEKEERALNGDGVERADNGSEMCSIPERGNWTNKLDFILSCVGYAVGLGNIWRFPYLCYKNGGGAFLIPYFLCLLMSGIPMFLLEITLGQFMARGCIMSWQICPLFQGVGYATTVICTFCNQYYVTILAWALYYFFKSFTTEVPWATCGNPWNTEQCIESKEEGSVGPCLNYTYNLTNETDYIDYALFDVPEDGNLTDFNTTLLPYCYNATDTRVSSSQEFWENKVLQLSGGLDEIGTLVWPLVLCLLLAWVLVYFIVWKGVKSSGKVVYFTATFPYVVLTIMLIRGVTLPGAGTGLLFYLQPDISRLRDPQVWIDAGSQIFYSYAVGFGTLTALGSYNKFHNNCYRDTLIVTAIGCCTSIYGGLVIFSVLGFMAYEQDVSVGEVSDGGPGLAFIAYPKALSLMPGAPFWSVLFFFMILLVGIDSQFVAVEGLITALVDIFPRQLRGGHRREVFTLVVCFLTFLSGLIFVTNGGMYVFKLYDYYAVSYPLFLIGAVESVVIAWVYGANRFYDNMEHMMGVRPFIWFKICWKFLVPLEATGIFIFAIVKHKPIEYNGYAYPPWGTFVGWALSLLSIMMIPITFIVLLLRSKGSLWERWHILTTPRLQSHQIQPTTDTPVIMDSFKKYPLEEGNLTEKERLKRELC